MSQLAEYLIANAAVIDGLIGELHEVSEPLTPSKLATIASVHHRFVDLLSKITRKEQSARSFVSKYLHFHNPAVPIYDGIAAQVLSKQVKQSTGLEVFDAAHDADEEYAWYLMRFFHLYEAVRLAGFATSVKLVDHYVLCLADPQYMMMQT